LGKSLKIKSYSHQAPPKIEIVNKTEKITER